MAILLTTPGTPSSIPGVSFIGIIVPALSTEIVDTHIISLSASSSAKWFITVEDNINLKTSTSEVLGQVRGFNSHHNEIVIGDIIDYIVDVTTTGASDISLEITNNENVDLYISFVRIQTI